MASDRTQLAGLYPERFEVKVESAWSFTFRSLVLCVGIMCRLHLQCVQRRRRNDTRHPQDHTPVLLYTSKALSATTVSNQPGFFSSCPLWCHYSIHTSGLSTSVMQKRSAGTMSGGAGVSCPIRAPLFLHIYFRQKCYQEHPSACLPFHTSYNLDKAVL